MSPDYVDMLSALCAEEVEFLIVGAFAVAAHGHPRYTGDIDFWVRATSENAQRLLRACQRFGAPLFDLSLEDLVQPEMVFQIGLAPNRIDFLTSLADIDFDEAWAERMTATMAGHRVAIVGKVHLIRSKRAAGRPKDLADLAALEAL